MTIGIAPIQTSYKGYRFRSRLEARWAVLFEHLKIGWTYEPEGYQLSSGWYLPDFRVKLINGTKELPPVFVEVKGDLDATNWRKLWEFASYEPLLILSDLPEPMAGQPPVLFPLFDARGGSRDMAWVAFSQGGVYGMSTSNVDSPPPVGVRLGAESGIVASAFRAARSARFEHGESP